MNQTKRIFIVVVVLFVIIGVILMVDFLQRQNAASQLPADMPPGSIPIYINREFIASFVPEDLNQLDVVSFTDDEEGKTQEGYLLRDVILLRWAMILAAFPILNLLNNRKFVRRRLI